MQYQMYRRTMAVILAVFLIYSNIINSYGASWFYPDILSAWSYERIPLEDGSEEYEGDEAFLGNRPATGSNAKNSNAKNSNATNADATNSDATSSNATDSNATDSNATMSNARAADLTILFMSQGVEITRSTVSCNSGDIAVDLAEPEGFRIKSVRNSERPERIYTYHAAAGRLRLDPDTAAGDILTAEIMPLLVLQYYYQGTLVSVEAVEYEPGGDKISLVEGTDFDIVLKVTEPEGDAEIPFDVADNTISVADVYNRYPVLDVYVDPQNHPIKVYYQTADGTVIAAQDYPSSDDNRIIRLSKLPKYHEVLAIESDIGADLIGSYDHDTGHLNLGLLSGDTVIYVIVKPVYNRFQIIPYFEKADYDTVGERYEQGTVSEEYFFDTHSLTEAAGKQIPLDGLSMNSFTYRVNESDFDGEFNSGVAVYSVYYNRKQYLMIYDAGGGILNTEVPYDYAQKLRFGQSIPAESTVPAPTRYGYQFTNQWRYYDSDAGAELSSLPAVMPEHNVRAVAQWTPSDEQVKVTVVYHYQNIYDDGYSVYSSVETVAPAGAYVKLDGSGNVYWTKGSESHTMVPNSARAEAEYFDYTELAVNAAVRGTGVEVNGDGSTIVNVYFNRNLYTVRFSMHVYQRKILFWDINGYASMTIYNDGEWIGEYNKDTVPLYTIQARYGENIFSRWPAGNNVTNVGASGSDFFGTPKFGGWGPALQKDWPDSNGDGIQHAYMDKSLIETYFKGSKETTLHAIVVRLSKPDEYTLTMRQERFDYDKTADLEFDLIGQEKTLIPGLFDEQTLSVMPGTIKPSTAAGTVTAIARNDYLATYLLNRYQPVFHANGGYFPEHITLSAPSYDGSSVTLKRQSEGETVRPEQLLQYGAELHKYGYSAYEEILPVRDHYHFFGWYRDPLGVEAVDWSNPRLLPADETDSEVTYYAKWEKVRYQVNFYDTKRPVGSDGYYLMSSQRVTYEDTLPEQQEPDTTKPGYHFLGWYTYVKGERVSYTSGLPIMGDTDIYGEWEPVARVPYQVIYRFEDGREAYPPGEISYGALGETVTVYAKGSIIDDGILKIPDQTSRSVTLKAGENKILFTYKAIPAGARPQYSIRCFDDKMQPIAGPVTIVIDGQKQLYTPGDLLYVPGDNWSVTVRAPEIPGFQPLVASYSNVGLSADSELNEFHFQYDYMGELKYELAYYDMFGNLIRPVEEREGRLNQVISSDNTSEIAVPIDGYTFSHSAFKREDMNKELRSDSLTLSSADAAAAVLTRFHLYYSETVAFTKQPANILTEISGTAELTAVVRGVGWSEGEALSKISVERLVNGEFLPVADLNSSLQAYQSEPGRLTLSWNIPAGDADIAGIYRFWVEDRRMPAVCSEQAVVSYWELQYRNGANALYTSTINTPGDESPNDTAAIILHSGYGGDAAMDYTGITADLADTTVDDDYRPIAANRNNVGTTLGNSRLALSVRPELGRARWEIGLYNYNAVTVPRKGTIDLTLSVGGGTSGEAVDVVKVKVVMEAAQLNATVPIRLTAKADMAGGQAQVPTNYTVLNESGFPIELAGIETTPEDGFALKEPENLATTEAKDIAIRLTDSDGGAITLREGITDMGGLGSESLKLANRQKLDLGLQIYTSPIDPAIFMSAKEVHFATMKMLIHIPE